MYQVWFVTADAAACGMLAAACAIRAMLDRANAAGVLLVAALSALAAPVIREGVLRGSSSILASLEACAAFALAGSLGGMLLSGWRHADRAFYALDFFGMALAVGLACFSSLAQVSPLPALLIGLASGLAPGLMRDTGLGAEPLCLAEKGHAASAAIAAMATVACALAPSRWAALDFFWAQAWLPALCGACAGTLARLCFWRHARGQQAPGF